MPEGLKTTFALLAESQNEAAGRALLAALESPLATVRDQALAAILRRRSPAGHREVLNRLHRFDARWQEIIRAHAGQIVPTLRSALLSPDPQVCANACLAACWFREYDLVPVLLNALETPANPNADLLGRTLLELTQGLCGELAGAREDRRQRDPQGVRRRLVGALELSVKRYVRHQRREVLEAFALLVYRDNVTLKQVLENPHHPAFVPLVDLLARSPQGSVVGLLLSFLDDPRAPSAAISVAARRSDRKFVESMLRKVGREPSAAVAQNLRRMESIAWLRGGELLGELDDPAQHAAVRLVMTSGTPRPQALAAIEHLLLHGKPGGRRAAAEALAEFHGAEANQLALRALKDEDPEVQARALAQLRGRGIPNALSRLIESLESPHAAVRKAARKSLSEFTLERFLGNFDLLDDEVRRSTGELVKRVDPQAVTQLRTELGSKVRSRRLRGLAAARCLDVARELEATVLGLLEDDDHMVRAEAAATLASCRTMTSHDALLEALSDRSPIVQEAARNALADQGWPDGEECSPDYFDPRELSQ